jgi:hypothetical protein
MTQYAPKTITLLYDNAVNGQPVQPSTVVGFQASARVTNAGSGSSRALSSVATLNTHLSFPACAVATNGTTGQTGKYKTKSGQSADNFALTSTHMFLSPANGLNPSLGPTIFVTQWDTTSGAATFHLNTASTTLSTAFPNGTLTRAASRAITNFAAISSQRLTTYGYIFVCAAPTGVTQSSVPEMVIGYVPVPAQSGNNADVFACAEIAQGTGTAVTKSLTTANTGFGVTGVAPVNFVHTTFFGTTYVASSGSGSVNASFWTIQPDDPASITDFTYSYSNLALPYTLVASGMCNYTYVCAIADVNTPPILFMSSPQTGVVAQGILPVISANQYARTRVFEWGECTYGSTPSACVLLQPPQGDAALICTFAYLDASGPPIVRGSAGEIITSKTVYTPPAGESIIAFSFVDASATNFKIAFAVRSSIGQTVYTSTFNTASGEWSAPFDIMFNTVHLHDQDIVFLSGGRKGAGLLPSVSVTVFAAPSETSSDWRTFVYPVDDV